eukprot:UN31533
MRCSCYGTYRIRENSRILIPILQRLQSHSQTIGIRAIIISPTRELVLQTHKFVKKMSKHMDFRIAVILGGEALQKQFDALSMNPDIILATPGRLVHVIKEVELNLNKVEIIVYDEADRLFELGFAMQIREIQRRLPHERQVLLFSATIPAQLVEFTNAALKDPQVVRLDTEQKISEKLVTQFILCRNNDKRGCLLYLLTQQIPKKRAEYIILSDEAPCSIFIELIKNCRREQCYCIWNYGTEC